MRRQIAIAWCALLLLSNPATSTAAPGTLFIAGTVAAGPDQEPSKNFAIYVEGGLIREVGAASALRGKYSKAHIVDASGATILPGLTDAHGYLGLLGNLLQSVNLVGTASYEEVIARVKERAAKTPRGQWILGHGWDQNDWQVKEFPNPDALSAAVPDHPVYLDRIDVYVALVNAAAMRAAGVTRDTKDPHGGMILRSSNGDPTGLFVDEAVTLVRSHIPALTLEQRKARLLAAAQNIAQNGITEIHDPGDDAATISALKELIDEKRLPIRVYAMLSDEYAGLHDEDAKLSDEDQLVRTWFARGPLIGYGGRLTVRAVKLFGDGTLGSRSAALLAPYSDRHDVEGLVRATEQHIEDVARRARAAGFQVNTHGIGDGAVRNIIDAYSAAGVTPEDRFRIEHLQVINLADLPRLVREGIIGSMQPTHATSDMYWVKDRLGEERLKGAYAWKTILNAGGRIALGLDFPVEAVNPFFGFFAAVTREDQNLMPPGGWRPSERLSLAQALRGFRKDAAYAAFEESSRGTIEPGKLADLTIVDGDFFAVPVTNLFKTKVRATVVGGEVVYSAN